MQKEIHQPTRTKPVLPEAIPQLRKQIEAVQVESQFIKAGLSLIPMQTELGSMLDDIKDSVSYVLNLYVALSDEKNIYQTTDSINAQLASWDVADVLSGIEACARLRLSSGNERLGLRAANAIKALDTEFAELIRQYKAAAKKNPDATDEQFKALDAQLTLITLFKTSVASPSPALESALNKVSEISPESEGSVLAAAEAILNFRPEGSPKEFGATLTGRFEFHQTQIMDFTVSARELAEKLRKTSEELDSLEDAVKTAGIDAINSKILKSLENSDSAALSTELCAVKTRTSKFRADLSDAVRSFVENAPEAKIDPLSESDRGVLERLLEFWRLVPEYKDSHLNAARICQKLGQKDEARKEMELYRRTPLPPLSEEAKRVAAKKAIQNSRFPLELLKKKIIN